MDDLLPKILIYPPVPTPAEPLPDSQRDHTLTAVSQLLTSTPTPVLASDLSTGEDIFDVLDPASHSLAYLHVLRAHIEASRSPSKSSPTAALPPVATTHKLWSRIITFLQEFDPIQVRYAGSHFRSLMEMVCAQGGRQTHNLSSVIALIRTAMLRLDPTSSTLTSIHYGYIRLCLHGAAFQEALPILERTIYHIPSVVDKATAARSHRFLCSEMKSSVGYLNPEYGLTHKLTSRDYLEYHIYGAMIYMCLKEWEKAITFLEIVLSTPTSTSVSAIMVEAYKKWVLVGLLMEGKARSLPKGVNQNGVRNIQALAKPYDCLVEAFASGNLARLKAEVEEGQNFWLHDCNFGLVVQVYDAFRKFSVLRLADVYVALPLTEVCRRTSPDPSDVIEAASYITTLIASGELKASLTLSQDPGRSAMLRFLSFPSVPRSEGELYHDLQADKAQLECILKHLQDTDHRLEISKEFIEKMRWMKKQKEQEWKVGGTGGQLKDDFDEDVMGEL